MEEKKTNVKKTTKKAPTLREKLATSENEKKEMLEMMKAMQAQIDSMKNQSFVQPTAANDNDKEVEVGCKLFNGGTLSSVNGDISVSFKCGEETDITVRELKEIFRNPFDFKSMFKKGVFYFTDKEMYSYFKIRDVVDLSNDELKKYLLESTPSNMINFLKNVTRNRRNDMVCHTICYNVALMLYNNELQQWGYENREAFEDYMKIRVSDVVKHIKDVESADLI